MSKKRRISGFENNNFVVPENSEENKIIKVLKFDLNADRYLVEWKDLSRSWESYNKVKNLKAYNDIFSRQKYSSYIN